MNREDLFEFAKEAFVEVIEKVYNKGFEDGVASVNDENDETDQIITEEENYRWIDLGLKSGNLWAVGKFNLYPQAEEKYLPTEADIIELINLKLMGKVNGGWFNGYSIIGLNGIILNFSGQEFSKVRSSRDYHKCYIWEKSDINDYNERSTLLLEYKDKESKLSTLRTSIFAGDKAQILYCKHPND